MEAQKFYKDSLSQCKFFSRLTSLPCKLLLVIQTSTMYSRLTFLAIASSAAFVAAAPLNCQFPYLLSCCTFHFPLSTLVLCLINFRRRRCRVWQLIDHVGLNSATQRFSSCGNRLFLQIYWPWQCYTLVSLIWVVLLSFHVSYLAKRSLLAANHMFLEFNQR